MCMVKNISKTSKTIINMTLDVYFHFVAAKTFSNFTANMHAKNF